MLFRRLAVFVGGFDLDAAHAVATDELLQAHQVFDEVTLLVDKSLVVAENASGRTRYRLLETVRQYALEKLGDSGEADATRTRHRDYYTTLAAVRDEAHTAGRQQHVERADLEISVASVREGLGDTDFDDACAEGAGLSTMEAISYAQRGRGERKRPASGWAALTPAEHDVVRLVREGLPNKDIVAQLFISPRTVQSHLTHVYNKLGVSSRLQLAHVAASKI